MIFILSLIATALLLVALPLWIIAWLLGRLLALIAAPPE